MSKPEISAVSAVQTAIGCFDGALKDVPLSQLAITTVREAIARAMPQASATWCLATSSPPGRAAQTFLPGDVRIAIGGRAESMTPWGPTCFPPLAEGTHG
ncbi:hypothetical protein [Paraburkholderia xenovorans]